MRRPVLPILRTALAFALAALAGTWTPACAGADECDPMQAKGEGDCEAFLGVRWDGEGCVTVSGCDCDGRDCDELFSSQETCSSAFAGC